MRAVLRKAGFKFASLARQGLPAPSVKAPAWLRRSPPGGISSAFRSASHCFASSASPQASKSRLALRVAITWRACKPASIASLLSAVGQSTNRGLGVQSLTAFINQGAQLLIQPPYNRDIWRFRNSMSPRYVHASRAE